MQNHNIECQVRRSGKKKVKIILKATDDWTCTICSGTTAKKMTIIHMMTGHLVVYMKESFTRRTETFRVIDNDWASCCVPDTCIVQALEEVHSRLRDARSRTSSAQKVISILNAKVSELRHEVEDRRREAEKNLTSKVTVVESKTELVDEGETMSGDDDVEQGYQLAVISLRI